MTLDDNTFPAIRLLFWMSHKGQGSIREALDAFSGDCVDVDIDRTKSAFYSYVLNSVRIGFITRTRSTWTVSPPSLTATADAGSAVWRGGLSLRIFGQLEAAVKDMGCQIELEFGVVSPPHIKLRGNKSNFKQIARELNVAYQDFGARIEAGKLRDIGERLQTVDEEPSYDLETYDYDSRSWTVQNNQNLQTGAYRKKSKFDRDRYWYCVNGVYYRIESETGSTADGEKLAIFLADKSNRLCQYDRQSRTFNAQNRLPSNYATPLCLCSGQLPSLTNGREVYSDVPQEIGEYLLQVLGQAPKEQDIYWI